MKSLSIVLFSVFVGSVAQAGDSVTCEMRSLKNKSIKATMPLSAIGKGINSEGAGLNVGRDNYSFAMGLEKEGSAIRIDVMFYENNNVQDEIGGVSCKVKKSVSALICQETIKSESEKVLANFACKLTK